MASNTGAQLRRFNGFQRPEKDTRGAPNHWHFDVREMPQFPGELVFITNPFNRAFHGEGRTKITGLPVHKQAQIIIPLLLEAFDTQFDGSATGIMADMRPFAPFSWSTTNEALARAISTRCRTLGIRTELSTVTVSSAEHVKIADVCWKRWESDVTQAIMGYHGLRDDGEENVELEGGCAHCHFTPSLERPLFPCSHCGTVYYCSEQCQVMDSSSHAARCAPDID